MARLAAPVEGAQRPPVGFNSARRFAPGRARGAELIGIAGDLGYRLAHR
jgi:hypothetical protein